MKIQSKFLTALIVLTSVSALAVAAVDGLTVKRTVKEGQVYKLKVKGELEISGTQATFEASDTSKITKVDTDGSYAIESTQTDAKANVGGQDVPIPDSPPVTTVYNADGSVKQMKGDDAATSAGAYRMANLQALIDPGKPLNVGDTWSIDIKADSKTGVEAAKADYKILPEEKVGDIDTIKVQTTFKETTASEPASSEGTVWISKADGSLVKAELNWKNAPIPGAPAPISGKMTLSKG